MCSNLTHWYSSFIHWTHVQDDVKIEQSGDVEAMLALLESGQPLPPDPREAGTTREDAASFTARLDKIVARYESQFLKRKEWRVGPYPSNSLPNELGT